MMATVRFKNTAEQQLYERLTDLGWDVTKRGWPDFACFRNGRVVLVEVKPNSQHPLKREQRRLMAALAGQGVDCFHWSPDGGPKRILPNRSKHRLQ